MLVDAARLELLFRKAQQVREEISAYVIVGDKVPVSIEDLQAVVGRMYRLTITKHLVPATTTFVQSMMQRFADNRVLILVKTATAHDEKRFCVAKEISHLIMDEREDWSCDAVATISGLVEFSRLDVKTNGEQEAPNRVILAENLASFLAMELLYPPDLREADFEALRRDETSLAKLALRYELPAKVIETAHSQWYRELRAECCPE